MDSNKIIIVTTLIGTYLGSWFGFLMSGSYFSFTAVLTSAIGGVAGIWAGWRLIGH